MEKAQGFANVVVFENVLNPLVLLCVPLCLRAVGAADVFCWRGLRGNLVLLMTSHSVAPRLD